MGASLGLSYIIVFASGFADRAERQQRGLLLSSGTETLVAYSDRPAGLGDHAGAVSQLHPGDPWQEWLRDTLVLGVCPLLLGARCGSYSGIRANQQWPHQVGHQSTKGDQP